MILLDTNIIIYYLKNDVGINIADSIVAATAAILNASLASRDRGFKKVHDIELLTL